ncbi:MAG: hypothetical protein EOM90_02030 [Alphaproteobacteria bacterium]|nr:hypothetical protein [Alphaproteobacteria bacterium]
MSQKNAIRIVLFGLGFLTLGFQVLLMRGFLVTCYGNEMVIGILLAIWMLFTGFGSWVGRFSRFTLLHHPALMLLLVISGIWPAPALFLLNLLKAVTIPAGSMAGLEDVFIWGAIVQAPFCLCTGFLFTVLSTLPGTGNPSASYAWESGGSIVACLAVNFIFLGWFDLFTGALLLSVLWFLTVSVSMGLRRGWIRSGVILAFAAVYLLTIFRAGLAEQSENLLFPDQKVVSDRVTPYGRISVTRSGDQFNFYENGLLLFSSGNTINSEEAVHPAMVQRPNPLKVLMISGGFSGALTEVMKYHPGQVDYLELNPDLIRVAAQFTSQIKSENIRTIRADARRFLIHSPEQYDVVIVNLPSPATLQINRYFTAEFFEEAYRHMTPNGVIALFLPTASDYISPRAADLNSVICRTLRHRFRHVLIVPLEKNVVLASDSALTLDIPGKIRSLGIQTSWVNPDYLDISQLRERSGYLEKNLQPTGKLNRDFDPVAVHYQLAWWLGYFSFKPLVAIALYTLLFLILAFSQNRLTTGMFTGGFTLASIEIILILAYQALFGYLFSMIGAIIVIFMAGLTIGSWLGPFLATRWIERRSVIRSKVNPEAEIRENSLNGFSPALRQLYFRIQIVLAVFSMLIPVFLLFIRNIAGFTIGSHLLTGLLCLFPAFLIGLEYHLSVTIPQERINRAVSGSYSADLFGSAMGAFTTGVILIPLAGVNASCVLLGILNLAGAWILYSGRRK